MTFILATTAGLPAAAQSRDAAAATELFEKGRAAMKQQDFATACAAFTDSVRFDTKVGTLLNLADCEEHLGRLISARAHWQQAVALAHSVGDARENIAKQRFSAVDPRVAKLAVRLAPDAPVGSTVRRDDVELGAGSFGVALPVDPGVHAIAVSAPGYEDKTVTANLADGEVQEIVVGPGPKVAAPPPPPVVVAAAPPESRWSTNKTLAVIAAGVGLAGGGLGTYFGLHAKSVNDASNASGACDATDGCNSAGLAQRSDAVRDGNISTIAFIAGGAFVATGVVLWLTAPSRGRRPAPKAGLVVLPRALGLVGSF